MKEREFLELAGREPVITARQVASILGNQRYSKVYLHRLVKRGLIRRLKRGFYTVYDDPVVVHRVETPFQSPEKGFLHGVRQQGRRTPCRNPFSVS